MECQYCKTNCIKAGRQVTGLQRYYCKNCKKYQQEEYLKNAYKADTNLKIIAFTKESCGIRSISRLLKISTNTVIRRIKLIAKQARRPFLSMDKIYEMDEMRTYVKSKKNEYWIAYAIRRDTREVVDLYVGKRNKRTLNRVVDTLLLSDAKRIFTDRLNLYESLIPEEIHRRSKYRINYIERKNLSVRTHLKRLNRRTICFSKSIEMLEACLKIYFWCKV